MTKFLGAAFRLSSVIVGFTLLVGSSAFAAEEATVEADAYETNADTTRITVPELVKQDLQQKHPLAQVTSVSQLEDVQPTDWAFQALQSLIERYGVIVGYPDGTFRGNRAMTRYEFAAALNAALVRINEIIDAGLADRVREEDLTSLQRLRSDFALELATVRNRVDTLEASTARLEATQFSTTTKLNGTVTWNIAAASAGGDVKVERIDPQDAFSAARRGADGQPIVTRVANDPNVTFSYITGLFLTTSFTGKDSLVTTLAAGNGNSPANVYTSAGLFNTFGVPGSDFTPTTIASQLALLETFYSFPLNDSLQVVVGPKFFWLRYFDTNAFTSIFNKGAGGFNTFGSTLAQDLGRTTGAVLLWRFNEELEFRVGYTTNADGANPNRGLFNGSRALTSQLTYSPNSNINLRLLYDHSKIEPVDGQIRTRPIVGVADDGFGGALENATGNVFEANFDWLVTPKFGVFGRYSYASTHLNPARDSMESGNIRAQSVQIGVAFPDLGKRGALATLSYVIPFDVLEGRQFLVSGGGDGGTQYDIEATYYFPVTDNIAIIPTFYMTGNPNNFNDNPTVFSGAVRTEFNF
ncbi:iron uptake porin [Argonema galeatum]|uniref:iron uptake porin n=1 Tax=Argonema galeatum TaxID=2942762 RepID=UPI002010DB50|nr:iron uptake porin [Argonema galeatum]MCL1464653.1 iron uptake porin [Argonema galeatum A003/A1]